jgi:hypothetical protein
MVNTSCIRIQRAGISYDLPKETVRRVCACHAITPIAGHSAYACELEGLPALLMEPNVLRAGSRSGPGDGLPAPRFAVLVGGSADMPVALAADSVDPLAGSGVTAVTVTADQVQSLLHHPI